MNTFNAARQHRGVIRLRAPSKTAFSTKKGADPQENRYPVLGS
jgi:hypothetical protein